MHATSSTDRTGQATQLQIRLDVWGRKQKTEQHIRQGKAIGVALREGIGLIWGNSMYANLGNPMLIGEFGMHAKKNCPSLPLLI